MMHKNGFSSLMIVLILSFISAMMISTAFLVNHSTIKNNAIRIQHFNNINLVESALHWGSQLIWHEPSDVWNCKPYKEAKICIKKSHYSLPIVMLKGEFQQLRHYRLAEYDKSTNKLIMKQASWLDYCIDEKEINCD